MTNSEAKQLRIQLGHSQQSIATKMKLSISYIQKMENGDKPISAVYIKMLAKLYKAANNA